MSKKTQFRKTIIPNTNNLPITEYWDELPKRNNLRDYLLSVLSKKTGRETATIRNWFLGRSNPPTDRLKGIISETLQSSVETLFPN